MASVAKGRLVYCPKCRNLLPEVPQFPLYRCGNCMTILQAKHANTKLQIDHKKAESLCIGSASRCERMDRISAKASSSGSEFGSDEVELGSREDAHESYRDKHQLREETFPSSADDCFRCNRNGQPFENGEVLCGVHDREHFDKGISSTVSEQNVRSKKVKEPINPYRRPEASDHHLGCNELVGVLDYRDEQNSQKKTKASVFNGVDMANVASATQYDRMKVAASTSTTQCQVSDGCSSSSPVNDFSSLITDQKANLSRRTLFKPELSSSTQQSVVAQRLTESIKNDSSFPETSAVKATRPSLSLQDEGKIASSKLTFEGSDSLSRAGINVNNSQIENLVDSTKPILGSSVKQKTEYSNRSVFSRFQLQEPSCCLGECTKDQVPHGYVDMMHSNQEYVQSDPLVPNRIECVEQETLLLLRKLDELRDCISKSHIPRGRQNGRIPIGSSGIPCYETDPNISFAQGVFRKQAGRTMCFCENEFKIENVNHHLYNPKEGYLPIYMPPPHSHALLRSMPEACGISQSSAIGQSRAYGSELSFFDGNNVEMDPETVGSQCADSYSKCVCLDGSRCCVQSCRRPSQIPSCICSNQGLYEVCNGNFCCHANDPSHVFQQVHMDSRLPPSDPNSNHPMGMKLIQENAYFEGRYSQDIEVGVRTKAAACNPILGGAPYVICRGCLKLLKLPPDFLLSKKRINKVKCGNCLKVLMFAVSGESIVPITKDSRLTPLEERCVSASLEHFTTCRPQEPSNELAKSRPDSDVDLQSEAIPCSEDYGTSIPFSSETESVSVPSLFPSSQTKRHAEQDMLTNSAECIKESNVPAPKEPVKKQQHLRQMDEVDSRQEGFVESFRAPPGSALHAHFGYKSAIDLLKRNDSVSSESEYGSTQFITHAGQSPVNKEILMQTPGIPEKMDRSQKEKRCTKDSTLSGFIKRGMKDLSLGLEGVKSKVFVNGKPIPDRLVKKAEDQAGPIQPGHYWYDHQAGFWGVMGHPCLGIVPPYIKEFNIPMPRNCSRGTTGVVVNGRELHQEDLRMLAKRGLPTAENREYIIDISGQGIDKTSGEILNLGSLAPSVQKEGRGTGMLVPTDIA